MKESPGKTDGLDLVQIDQTQHIILCTFLYAASA